MYGLRHSVLAISVALALGGIGAALAQENLDLKKTPQQMFASDCAVCHKSPQGLAKGMLGLQEFLRKHYTASRESAQALANYLSGVGDAPVGKPAATAKKPATKKDAAKPADAKPGEVKTDAKKDEPAKPAEPAAAASSAAPKATDPWPEVKPAEPAAAKPEKTE